ncbi:hypothetical protein KIN20_019454 [Parelaphostrongylus tenuis]|uniref:Uncharacterized protein n=1 Tax=Parelaphostrongylus tenuis TaxID=148309 RepID=A0AAD5N357_PARTN|nr:hypothetical protein KIN20_019454 [Parelaphostrongylus tenuis]
MSGEDGKALGKGDWEASEDEDLKTVLQSLTVSVDEYTSNESNAGMDKNVHTPQGSEHGDGNWQFTESSFDVDILVGDWTTNVQPPTVLPFDDTAAAVQHGIVTGCRQQAYFCEFFMTNFWKLTRAHKYLWHSEERRLEGHHWGRNEDIHSFV